MKQLLISMAIASSISSTGLAAEHAATRTYVIQQLGSTLDECESFRAQVENRFTEVTGLKTLGSTCNENVAKSSDMTLEYAVAETEPTFVSTHSTKTLAGGIYKNQAECKANIAKEVEDFQNNTGLKAVVALCYKNYRQSRSDTNWTLRIDSFGAPKKRPFLFTLHKSGSMAREEIEAQRTALLAHLSANGAANPRATIAYNGSEIVVSALYYRTSVLLLTPFDLGIVANQATCNEVKTQFNEIVGKAGGKVGLVLCAKSKYTNAFNLVSVASTPQPLTQKVSGLTYRTTAECDKQRPVIEQKWRDALNRNILGSVCAKENVTGDYKVEMRLFWVE